MAAAAAAGQPEVSSDADGDDAAAQETAVIMFLILVLWGFNWHPRAACVVLASWLAWLGVEYAKTGGRGWLQVLTSVDDMVRCTRAASEDVSVAARVVAHAVANAVVPAAEAVAAMLVAWFVLLVPYSPCIWQALVRVGAASWSCTAWAWDSMSLEARCLVLLLLFCLLGVTRVLVVFWRSRKRVQENLSTCWVLVSHILFQLAFILCGTLIWWLVGHLPPTPAYYVVLITMSCLPAVASLRELLVMHREKALIKQQRSSVADWWRDLTSSAGSQKELLQDGQLYERMHLLLSYWSCWPLLYAAHIVICMLPSDGDEATGNGILVALIVWVQFWNVRYAYILPAVFVSVFSGCSGSIAQVLDPCVSALSTQLPSTGGFLFLSATGQRQIVVMAVSVGLFVLLFFKVASLVSNFFTFLFLIAAALESARCVQQRDDGMCGARLSFWVITMVWHGLLVLPVVGVFLTIWTPMVLLAAFTAGETMLRLLIFRTIDALLALLNKISSTADQPGAGAEPLLRDGAEGAG